MSFKITNIDLNDFSYITGRDKYVIGQYIRSIDVDQTNGNSMVTKPLEKPNNLTQYPQNPSNNNYKINTITTIAGTSSINLPLDAKYDYIRNRIWVSDAGNNRVLLIDSRDFSFISESKNIILPHSMCVDLNTGNCFVKSYVSTDIGVVSEVDSNGKIISFFQFATSFPYLDFNIQRNASWLDSIPKTNSIIIDNVNFNVLWSDINSVYLVNKLLNSISIYDLSSDGLYGVKNINVDSESGNIFVIASNLHGNSFVVQLDKYNFKLLGKSYINS